jgi:hypothetical protein
MNSSELLQHYINEITNQSRYFRDQWAAGESARQARIREFESRYAQFVTEQATSRERYDYLNRTGSVFSGMPCIETQRKEMVMGLVLSLVVLWIVYRLYRYSMDKWMKSAHLAPFPETTPAGDKPRHEAATYLTCVTPIAVLALWIVIVDLVYYGPTDTTKRFAGPIIMMTPAAAMHYCQWKRYNSLAEEKRKKALASP